MAIGKAGGNRWRFDAPSMRQLCRFGVAGGMVALVSALAYLAAVRVVSPLVASWCSYVVNVAIGYHVHARWTFAEAGGRGADDRQRAGTRYVLTSFCALALNSAWAWLLTSVRGAPDWVPVVPMVFATPLVTFAINRAWVFGGAQGPSSLSRR
jgi:putative flippase GtrA